MMPWLINAAQVDKFRKSQKALIILDASWHMPSEGRDAQTEFLESHIMGAQFFDINAFSDLNPNAPHAHMMITDEEEIGKKLGALGIRSDYKIILYDNSNLHTACRALWMLKAFGHNPQQLYILDGGLNAWNQYGGKTETGSSNPSAKPYSVMLQYVTQAARNFVPACVVVTYREVFLFLTRRCLIKTVAGNPWKKSGSNSLALVLISINRSSPLAAAASPPPC
jgi:3-mercaptopyruvate sulfurtransferase SseA